ncbi:hypothetical protein [Uliginosibacterium gangwonense]|uniref:hypothetical protein n=1 Tax=Uliginosibacterium gangwonense TaxID=392736 RepID=UPI00035FB9C6|nr:hypothetical protein [Uliginosibacterium gangwonense]
MPSVKPENTFIHSVHRHLSPSTYHEKMNNPYHGGTPDVWYSGNAGDLWVEYKFLPRVPQRSIVVANLSELQKDWLERRHEEGRTVAVIVGCPSGGIILRDPEEWTATFTAVEYNNRLLDRKQIAAWIAQTTTR